MLLCGSLRCRILRVERVVQRTPRVDSPVLQQAQRPDREACRGWDIGDAGEPSMKGALVDPDESRGPLFHLRVVTEERRTSFPDLTGGHTGRLMLRYRHQRLCSRALAQELLQIHAGFKLAKSVGDNYAHQRASMT